MTEAEELRAIAGRLRSLAESSPTAPEHLPHWYEESEAFRKYVAAEHPGVELPHFISHYLSDADIRARDADYRAAGQKTILQVIASFERGEVPQDVAFQPSLWMVLVVLAVIIIAARYLVLR
jgi:hypothetical protein